VNEQYGEATIAKVPMAASRHRSSVGGHTLLSRADGGSITMKAKSDSTAAIFSRWIWVTINWYSACPIIGSGGPRLFLLQRFYRHFHVTKLFLPQQLPKIIDNVGHHGLGACWIGILQLDGYVAVPGRKFTLHSPLQRPVREPLQMTGGVELRE